MLRLIRISLIFILAATCSGYVSAQDGSGECANSFIWKVRSPSNTVYLLGSIHVLNDKDYPLGRTYEAAYDDSQVAVFEVDLGEMEKPETSMKVLSRATLENGSVLSDMISPGTYEKTGAKLAELGANMELFDKSRPWFVAITLTVLKMQSLGLKPEYGIDKYFYGRAKSDGKEIKGLETVDEQIDALSSTGSSSEDEILLQTIDDLDLLEDAFNEMHSRWKCGDAPGLRKTVLKSFDEYPGLYQSLIVERNRKWLPEIESYLHGNENYLVIVGSGHLVGKDGLVKLLRDKGYSVEQL